MVLSVKQVSRAFDQKAILQGIDLDIEQGEIVCLLGASGSGKTTLLRIIAGLEQVDQGDVLLDGVSILPIPVHQRDFGLMFQDFALFPHMTVAQNVAFGLKMRGMSRHEQIKRVDAILEIVGLAGFGWRDVAGLSGGEKQRVALARSLAPNPRVLLLDEPLGSLDAGLRERLALDLRTIIKQTGLTAIHVTHDQQEAFAIADRIAIMHAGHIDQFDTPQGLYRSPHTIYAARFLGLTNILDVIGHQGRLFQTKIGDFALNGSTSDPTDALLIHPDGIQLAPHNGKASNFTGKIRECVFLGDGYRVQVQHHDGVVLTFKVANNGSRIPVLGEIVQLHLDSAFMTPLQR